MHNRFIDYISTLIFFIPLSIYFLTQLYKKLSPSDQDSLPSSNFVRNFIVGVLTIFIFGAITFIIRDEFTHQRIKGGTRITYEYSSTNQIAKNKFKKAPFSSSSQNEVNSLHAKCISGDQKSCETLFENSAIFQINSDYTAFYKQKACDGNTKEYCLPAN